MGGGWRRFWGERRLLLETPLSPQTPLSRRAAGFGLCASADLVSPVRRRGFLLLGSGPRRLTEPPQTVRHVGLSSVSLAADSFLCGGSLLERTSLSVTKEEDPNKISGSSFLYNYCSSSCNGRGGSVSRRGHNQAARNTRPTRMGTQVREEETSIFPATLREGVRGRGASSKRPLPRVSHPNVISSGGSAREGLLEKKPPPSQSPALPHKLLYASGGRRRRRGRGRQ